MSPKLYRLSCLLIVVATLSGCGGGGAKTYYLNRTTTVGQELSDLQAAHAKGAISPDEYEDQKERILSGQIHRSD